MLPVFTYKIHPTSRGKRCWKRDPPAPPRYFPNKTRGLRKPVSPGLGKAGINFKLMARESEFGRGFLRRETVQFGGSQVVQSLAGCEVYMTIWTQDSLNPTLGRQGSSKVSGTLQVVLRVSFTGYVPRKRDQSQRQHSVLL